MSCTYTIRTRQCPCGTVFSGIARKVDMQTKLHRLKCEICVSINPKSHSDTISLGYKYNVSKHGNITANHELDVILNNAIKKIEMPNL